MSYKNAILFTIVFISTLLVQSCVVENNDDSLQTDAKLVINSQSSPDGLWKINLSQTALSIDEIDFIENGSIRVEDLTNNQEIEFEYVGEGNYKSIGHIPQKGHNYELFVDTEQHGISTARTYVPTIGEITLKTSKQRDILGGAAIQIELSVDNISNQNNYYVWDVVNNESTPIANQIKLFNSSNVQNENELLTPDAPTAADPKGNGLVVFTESSDTGTFNASLIAAQAKDFEQNDQSPVFDKSFQIRIKAVSEDLYQHLKALNEYNQRNLPHSSSTFHKELYSNINNGYGIFGAYTEKIMFVN